MTPVPPDDVLSSIHWHAYKQACHALSILRQTDQNDGEWTAAVRNLNQAFYELGELLTPWAPATGRLEWLDAQVQELSRAVEARMGPVFLAQGDGEGQWWKVLKRGLLGAREAAEAGYRDVLRKQDVILPRVLDERQLQLPTKPPSSESAPQEQASPQASAKYRQNVAANLNRIMTNLGWVVKTVSDKTGIEERTVRRHLNAENLPEEDTLGLYAAAFSKAGITVTAADLRKRSQHLM
jgi:hypothetical protein